MDAMADHFTCPACGKPLAWHEEDMDWQHARVQDAVDCVLAYYGVCKR